MSQHVKQFHCYSDSETITKPERQPESVIEQAIMEVSRHHSTCCLIIRTCCITPNELARAGATYREMHRQGSCSSAHRLAARFHAHIYESMGLFYCHACSIRFCRVCSGCWVLGTGFIEYTYRTQTSPYERCGLAFQSVIILEIMSCPTRICALALPATATHTHAAPWDLRTRAKSQAAFLLLNSELPCQHHRPGT